MDGDRDYYSSNQYRGASNSYENDAYNSEARNTCLKAIIILLVMFSISMLISYLVYEIVKGLL